MSVARTAAVNVKGAYAQVAAATGFSYSSITLCMYGTGGGGDCYLVDIAIGPSGAEQVIVPNVLLDSMRGIPHGQVSITLPVAIPAGVRIAARVQEVTGGTRNVQLSVIGRAGGFNASPSAAGDVVTYGANTATTNGVLIDQGSVVNVFGSWAEMTPATTRAHNVLAIVLGTNQTSTASSAEFNLQLAIGDSGAELVVAEWRTVLNGGVTRFGVNVFDIAASMPAGTRLSLRSKATLAGSTDRVMTAIIIGG